MFVLIACLLAQFEPSPGKIDTLEQFVKKSEEYKKLFLESETVRAERAMKSNKGRPAAYQYFKQYLAALKKFEKNTSQLPQYPLQVTEMKIGDVGYPHFVFLGEEHDGFKGAKVIQVINKQTALCSAGENMFAVVEVDTSDFVDDGELKLEGIWKVSGRFKYVSTQQVPKTVFAISRWEHEQKFQEILEERKKQGEEEEEKSKKPSSSKSKKPTKTPSKTK